MPGALEEDGDDVLLGDVHLVRPAACPEEDQREEHEACGKTKGERETRLLPKTGHSPEEGHGYGGDHAADVDGGVEHGEVGGQRLRLLGKLELVGSQGDHAGFDATSADCNKEDANIRHLVKDILHLS